MSSIHASTRDIGIGEYSCGASDLTMFPCSAAGSGSACCFRQWSPSVLPEARDQFAKSVAVSVVPVKDSGASVHPMVTTGSGATRGFSP